MMSSRRARRPSCEAGERRSLRPQILPFKSSLSLLLSRSLVHAQCLNAVTTLTKSGPLTLTLTVCTCTQQPVLPSAPGSLPSTHRPEPAKSSRFANVPASSMPGAPWTQAEQFQLLLLIIQQSIPKPDWEEIAPKMGKTVSAVT